VLTQRELKSREDLFLELDRNGDGRVPQDEYRRAVDLIARYGVDATLDGHAERWDLDGDGEVERGELPEAAWRALEERRRAE
jgi:Ca2+-binding EF-hand superfamily protein